MFSYCYLLYPDIQHVSHVFFLQYDQMASQATQYGNELRNTKAEIAELNRMISRLQSEIESIKAQVNFQWNDDTFPEQSIVDHLLKNEAFQITTAVFARLVNKFLSTSDKKI